MQIEIPFRWNIVSYPFDMIFTIPTAPVGFNFQGHTDVLLTHNKTSHATYYRLIFNAWHPCCDHIQGLHIMQLFREKHLSGTQPAF